jgi:hypothetical protein
MVPARSILMKHENFAWSAALSPRLRPRFVHYTTANTKRNRRIQQIARGLRGLVATRHSLC